MKCSPCLLCAFCLLTSVTTRAQSDEPWSINFFLENDLFANTDLNYTNGIRLSTISPDLDNFEDPNGQKYPWVEKLNNLLTFVHPDPANPDNDTVHQNMVISLGQLMFTPREKQRVTLAPDDRPYAGYLYLGLGYHARTQDTLHSTEFNFGVVGPAALARQAQNLVHDIGGWNRFQGWNNQLKNEPAFQLIFERKHREGLVQMQDLNGLQMELISHWGASVGNVASYLNAGAELRIGWDLPDDFGTSTLRPGATTIPQASWPASVTSACTAFWSRMRASSPTTFSWMATIYVAVQVSSARLWWLMLPWALPAAGTNCVFPMRISIAPGNSAGRKRHSFTAHFHCHTCITSDPAHILAGQGTICFNQRSTSAHPRIFVFSILASVS